MSIRMIAKELYRLQQEVESFERALSTASPEERQEIEERLRKAKAERNRVRRVLEGTKEPPPYRQAR